jgi:hypothetical protein
MPRTTISLGIAGLAVAAMVTGCGTRADTSAGQPPGSSAADTTSPEAEAEAASVNAENMIADCMKRKGFEYIPHPMRYSDGGQVARYGGRLSILEPADRVRAFRSKYGFGQHSKSVYPNDPALQAGPTDAGENPNNAIREALDPARRKAYDLAYAGDSGDGKAGQTAQSGSDLGCSGEASEKYFGSQADDQDANRREYAKFENDPAVVKAAQDYADCLTDKGYRVASARPGRIEEQLNSQFTGSSGGASAADASTGQEAGELGAAEQEEAKQALEKEIKAALDDLDCRTGYAELARTRYAKAVRAGGGAG